MVLWKSRDLIQERRITLRLDQTIEDLPDDSENSAGNWPVDISPPRAGALHLSAEVGAAYPRHWHKELEFNLVLRGSGTYVVGDSQFEFAPGRQMWMLPGQWHAITSRSRDSIIWVVFVTVNFLRRISTTSLSGALFHPNQMENHHFAQLDPQQIDALDLQLERIHGSPWDRTNPDLFNAALGFAILQAWHWQQDQGEVTEIRFADPAVRIAVELLEKAGEAASVEEIAAQAGVTPGRLGELFRELELLPPTDHRERRQIQRFFELTHERHAGPALPPIDAETISECAQEAGFASDSLFARVFRLHFTIGPQEFLNRRL